MDDRELQDLIQLGESSKVQFKEIFSSADNLAAEICAFANTQGGKIIAGVDDSGNIIGLTTETVKNLNQMISNVCSQKIYPTISVITENINYKDKIVVVIDVPMGPNKFYMANGRDVWVKVGADKRRASREEMRRLLQESFNMFADEQPLNGTDINSLDKDRIQELVEKKTGRKMEELLPVDLTQLLHNMRILRDGKCTLAGLLLLGKRRDPYFPQYQISAVSWYGNDAEVMDYRESEDIQGNVSVLYEEGMAFIKRQLRKVQKGQHVNSLGILEIPAIALEEALINAIVHRNYFIQSNIRLFVFDNRVEIISPGCLPNTLSVEAIKTGVHMARNPILLSHIKDIKGIPYRGIGMGVARMIASCRESGIALDFFNEVEKSQFRVVFWRDEMLA
jgi:ATP-dependent DNA helicase RecG